MLPSSQPSRTEVTRSAKPTRPQPKKYLGCFRDRGDAFGPTGRDLDGAMQNDSSLTTHQCIAVCRTRGFRYAGTQYGTNCFCGNKYGSFGPGTCDYKCAGNARETSGDIGPTAFTKLETQVFSRAAGDECGASHMIKKGVGHPPTCREHPHSRPRDAKWRILISGGAPAPSRRPHSGGVRDG